eukprot:5214342-Alexandrium_andersonii.AAC.1
MNVLHHMRHNAHALRTQRWHACPAHIYTCAQARARTRRSTCIPCCVRSSVRGGHALNVATPAGA